MRRAGARHRFAEPSRNKDARIVPAADLLQLGCDLMQQAATIPCPTTYLQVPSTRRWCSGMA
jgi:hypothetical protein